MKQSEEGKGRAGKIWLGKITSNKSAVLGRVTLKGQSIKARLQQGTMKEEISREEVDSTSTSYARHSKPTSISWQLSAR